MNSEELEQSLRAEFEAYLKDVFSGIKQEISGFQEKLDSEFREHRSRVDQALSELAEKASFDRVLEESFRDTVTEHLRLARDEGARITATAIAEAEELHGSGITAQDVHTGFGNLRDAILEIGSKDSQAEILKSLVQHATEHTPRGAFFIVKNEHLVGWRVFGREDHEEPDAVRELFFPLSRKTALSEAVISLRTVSAIGEGFEDEETYLRRLGFSEPGSMFAIPLVARGRGVAVLYADSGVNDELVNSEALESLVCVAGLTVELLASGQVPTAGIAHAQESQDTEPRGWQSGDSYTEHPDPAAEQDVSSWSSTESSGPASWSEAERETSDEAEYVSTTAEPEDDRGFSFSPSTDTGDMTAADRFAESAVDEFSGMEETASETEPAAEEFAETFVPAEEEMSSEDRFEEEVRQLYNVTESVEPFEAEAVGSDSEDLAEVHSASSFDEQAETGWGEVAESVPDLDQGTEPVVESGFEYGTLQEEAELAGAEFEEEESGAVHSETETEPVEEVVEEPMAVAEPAGVASETVAADSAVPRRRFADRNIDLPIEVSDEERQYHNAARRFARLLVEEIRLYNRQQVLDGCEAHDLYDRLKEAIDRSREMYEKRIHEPVAKSFDYFNYELVNNLAEGDESKLGDSYPGAKV